jgi:penicillin-binding protein 2
VIASRPLSRSQLRSRFLWCVAISGLAFAVLAARLANLQVLQGSKYRYLSENNRIRLERLPAPRGMILDRRGEILADVRASFDAQVIPADIAGDSRDRVELELSETLALPLETVKQVVEGPGPPRWKPRVLKRRISRGEMATLEAHRLELPAVVVHANPVRYYPFGSMLGNVLGYMGEISAKELRVPAYAGYEAGDFLGRSGVEWAWERTLRGDPGGQQVEVDVQGRKLGVLAERTPHAGRNVFLTIDRQLQKAALDAMGGQVGSVVVLAVRTGEVLTMVSQPSFDPNILAAGVSSEDWEDLASNPLHPLQNRTIQGVYPPGSTFKIAMSLAGLAEGTITAKSTVFCPGELFFGGRAFRCWNKHGHGLMTLEAAVTQSCDVFFYQLGIDLGIEAIHRWATELGLGQATGIDLPSENEGLIPSEAWKRKTRNEPWYAGENLSVAIGQGYVLVTPLQLASMVASIAHPQGLRMRPHVVAKIVDAEGKAVEEIAPQEVGRLPFRAQHLEQLRKALRLVVASPRGTGRKAEVEGYPVAGKTGTSQVVKLPSDAGVPEDDIPWQRRDHALFVCYAPAPDPEIAVAVVLEHAGHGGSAAAPIARQVIQAYRSTRSEAVSQVEAGR